MFWAKKGELDENIEARCAEPSHRNRFPGEQDIVVEGQRRIGCCRLFVPNRGTASGIFLLGEPLDEKKIGGGTSENFR